MNPLALQALLAACAPLVHPTTAYALVSVESAHNPFAIGVVGGVLDHQPRNEVEALATASMLDAAGWNYSAGLAQINVRNFRRLGLDRKAAFDPCRNLHAMQTVLSECLARASGHPQGALRQALSCYYSGHSERGVREGYVARVVHAAQTSPRAIGAPRP